MVFNVNLTPPTQPPTDPAGKVSGKQDKAIYAKRKLSAKNYFWPQPKQIKQLFEGYNWL